jgi:NAD(P)-dependent dehydrogenase (short-subunit alcohol dehydrogenase family)
VLLKNHHALVFAATGAIASEVARTFAAEGAVVWLSARDGERLEALAKEIDAGGAQVHADVVDATSQRDVDAYVRAVTARAGRLDVVFNGIGGRPAELGYPRRLVDQSAESFRQPIERILVSQFLTARAAGLRMVEQGSGSIVMLSATLSGMAAAHMENISAVCGGVEALTRSLAGELGPHGVRVNCVRASAMPETTTIQETGAGQAEIAGGPVDFGLPPLGRPVTVAETAATVAFVASPWASATTGQVLTVCAGQFV